MSMMRRVYDLREYMWKDEAEESGRGHAPLSAARFQGRVQITFASGRGAAPARAGPGGDLYLEGPSPCRLGSPPLLF